MRRIATLLATLAMGGALAACGSDSNTNNANTNATRANANAASTSNANGAGRDGVIETNANLPANMNGRTAPPSTAVVTNDNGNKNTAGIRSINANTNASHNANANHNGAAKGNSNH